MIDTHHGWNTSLKPLWLGFVLSILLTAAAYLIVKHHHLTDGILIITITALAIIQTLIQLVFFLHIGLESKPHWNSITLVFAALVILIVIGGSVWIMNNLNYNLMSM